MLDPNTEAKSLVQGKPRRKVVTTEQLQQLLADGKKVTLPPVVLAAEHQGLHDPSLVAQAAVEREIVSVELTSTEAVQCIQIDHPRHLYITDDLLPTHNTSNIIFLKSTDDSMIETLSKMSGTVHRVYRDSKTVTRDVEKLFLQTEGKVSYTSAAKEEAVISYNDLAYLPSRNSIVFRAGDLPIWNRNETILPMSWRLFSNTIEHYGHDEYTLQTIPTLSTAIDFDVRQNQPDFATMLETRLQQAEHVASAADTFAKAYGFSTFDVERLDPDVYADEVLDIVRMLMGEGSNIILKKPETDDEGDNLFDDENYDGPEETIRVNDAMQRPRVVPDMNPDYDEIERKRKEVAHSNYDSASENTELKNDVGRREREDAENKVRRYAGGRLDRNMLHDQTSGGAVINSYDVDLITAFLECKGALAADDRFMVQPDNQLFSAQGVPYIIFNPDPDAPRQHMRDAQLLDDAAQDTNSRVFAEDDSFSGDALSVAESNMYIVTTEFKKWLISLEDWKDIADGKWDQEVKHAITKREEVSGNHDNGGL